MPAERRVSGADDRRGLSCPGSAQEEPTTIWTVVEKSVAAAEKHASAWQELAGRAVEPNAFYEPWNLLAALDTIAASIRVRLLFVYVLDAGECRLIGFFPFEVHDHYKGLPVRRLRLVKHVHCFLCVPLVHVEYTERCLRAFADWVAESSAGSLVEMDRLTGTLREAIQRHLQQRSVKVTLLKRQHRALFRPAKDAATYLRQAMRRKYRKEFGRKQRRLAECGRLEYRWLGLQEDVRPWIEAFQALEMRGWKGRNDTALASSAAGRVYFERIATKAHRLGKLDFVGYFLDGAAVALSCKFNAGRGAFAFKIAFDEKFSRYSPGMLLELRHVEYLHEQKYPRWMDSCAEPHHFMANRLWVDRRSVETLAAAVGPWGRVVLAITTALRDSLDFLSNVNVATDEAGREQQA